MKVTFKNVKNEKFELEVEPSQKVSDVKSSIESLKGADAYPRASMTLIHKGKTLSDEQSMEDAGVTDNTFIVVFVKKAPPAKAAVPPASKPTPSPAPQAARAPDESTAAPEEPAPDAGAAPEADAPGAPLESAGRAVSGADAFATGSELRASIQAIQEMGFPEADVQRAMRAAFNNPDRAVEYLMTGLPAAAQPSDTGTVEATEAGEDTPAGEPAPAAAAVERDPPNVAAAAPPAVQSQGGGQGPNPTPLDLWGGSAPDAAGAEGRGGGGAVGAPFGDGPGAAAFERSLNPEALQQLRQTIAQNPEALNVMIQEMAQRNPALAQQLSRNPQALLQMLLGGMEAGDGVCSLAEKAPLGGGAEVQLDLTEADQAAIRNLEGLGFPRAAVIQAYIACDKNEEMAANFLMDQGNDFAEDMES